MNLYHVYYAREEGDEEAIQSEHVWANSPLEAAQWAIMADDCTEDQIRVGLIVYEIPGPDAAPTEPGLARLKAHLIDHSLIKFAPDEEGGE